MRAEAAAKAATTTAIAAICATATRRARTREVGPTEEWIFRSFNDAPDALHPPVWAVMQFGSLGAVFVTAGLMRPTAPSRAAAVAVAGTAAWGGVKLVKPLVGRGRPQEHLDGVNVRGQPQTGLGFPSGHAAVATTLTLVATSRGTTARRVAGAAALVTCAARMYVGAHLPLDVVGGMTIGVAAGWATNLLRRR